MHVFEWAEATFRDHMDAVTVERCERDGRQGYAVLSKCWDGDDTSPRFRHILEWVWDFAAMPLFVIMLNPSTATAFADDQTMKKVFEFARRAGYGGVCVINQCDFRATKPEVAKAAGWPTSGFNKQLMHRVLNDLGEREDRRDVLCAWGNHGPKLKGWAVGRKRDPRVRLLHLGLSKGGHPVHPCMIGYDRPWVEFTA